MNDEVLETNEETQVSRRGLLVKGGLAAAGLTALGSPAAAAFAASSDQLSMIDLDGRIMTPAAPLAAA